jgi:sugar transferase (PEP-CTERM/EpsH1 system associated)
MVPKAGLHPNFAGMRLLMVLSRFPYPVLKGDKLRAYYQLAELGRHHQITLVCTTYDRDWLQHLPQVQMHCQRVEVVQLRWWHKPLNLLRALFNGNPFQAEYFRSRRASNRIAALVQETTPDAVYVQLVRSTENLPATLLSVHRVLDYMDCMSAGMDKRAAFSPWYLRGVVAAEARRLRRYEARIAAQFDACTVITEADRALLPESVRPRTHIVPNGLAEEFRSAERLPRSQRDIPVLFTGNMSYHPNVKAAEFLVREVMPLLWTENPNLTLYLVGTDPTPEVRALASNRVTVTGFVPHLLPYVQRAQVFVAPMFSGAGLQNKLLEAQAVGVPSVASPQANAALGAEPGREVLVATDARSFAQQIRALLYEPDWAETLGQAGRHFVLNTYSWQRAGAELEALLFPALVEGHRATT